MSINGGDSFTEFTGVPFWGGRHITFDRTDQVMYVSTGGGGVFKCPMPGAAVAERNVSRNTAASPFMRSAGRGFTITDLPPRSAVAIYRSNGQLVRKLAARECNGRWSITWDGYGNARAGASAGVYVYRIVSNAPQTRGGMIAARWH